MILHIDASCTDELKFYFLFTYGKIAGDNIATAALDSQGGEMRTEDDVTINFDSIAVAYVKSPKVATIESNICDTNVSTSIAQVG